MRIAFSDIGNYLSFGQEEREGEYGSYKANVINLNDSSNADTQLIQEVKQERE